MFKLENMNALKIQVIFFTLFSSYTYAKDNQLVDSEPYRITKNISYANVNVDLVIDKPENNEVDVLIVFHGTVFYDKKILEGANHVLDKFKQILNRKDMMIVSVAYPEENLLMGDNFLHAEAGLLWIKHRANRALGVHVKKIFLAGHSQGGYLVTRLNTMYQTNGVIANGPGPLNLVYRCQLEENGRIQPGITCTLLKNTFGKTDKDSNSYYKRSLLNFTSGFKSDILFVQGMNDTQIQLYSWPIFKEQVTNCSNCQNSQFLEIPNYGHAALFESPKAKEIFNDFINSR
jgi:hypothetical protein